MESSAPFSLDPGAASARCRLGRKRGLHVRPAMQVAQLARGHAGAVRVSCAEETADGKSVMSLLMLAAGPGAELIFTAEGAGAEELLARIRALFETQFAGL